MKEIEVKILEIDPEKIRQTLKENGAKLVKKVFQRNILCGNDYTRENDIVVRIREEGEETIITVKTKKMIVNEHKVRNEIEAKTVNREQAKKLFEELGYKKNYIIEVKREYYSFENCSVEIVELPKTPIFLEIEGNEEDILKVTNLLGYSKKDYCAMNMLEYYEEYNKAKFPRYLKFSD